MDDILVNFTFHKRTLFLKRSILVAGLELFGSNCLPNRVSNDFKDGLLLRNGDTVEIINMHNHDFALNTQMRKYFIKYNTLQPQRQHLIPLYNSIHYYGSIGLYWRFYEYSISVPCIIICARSPFRPNCQFPHIVDTYSVKVHVWWTMKNINTWYMGTVTLFLCGL